MSNIIAFSILSITFLFVNVQTAGSDSINDNGPNEQIPVIINLEKKYPEKKINLRDFAAVKYVALESNKQHPFSGTIVAVTDNIIIGHSVDEIFIFSSNGKIEKVIRQKGRGPGEYNSIDDIAFDDTTDEIFVNDVLSRKVFVYNLSGELIREFPFCIPKEFYWAFTVWGNNLIVCNDKNSFYKEEKNRTNTFFTISKTNGDFILNLGKYHTTKMNNSVYETKSNSAVQVYNVPYPQFIPSNDGYILNDLSCDTIYKYSDINHRTPILIRTPSIKKNSTKPQFWFVSNETERYLFGESVIKNESGKEKFEGGSSFIYDKFDEKTYTPYVYDENFNKGRNLYLQSINKNIAISYLPAFLIVSLDEKGLFKGELQEIASGLDINDNPVLIIAKYK